ncbi:hypothetical protein KKI24_11215 [bacterium]|nr:hypothetical protein [bacterium]
MKRRGRRKNQGTSFSPNREYVSSAILEYLKTGGKITLIKAEDENYENFMNSKVSGTAVHEYLTDNSDY